MLSEIEKVLDREYRRNVLRHPGYATDGTLAYHFLLAIWTPTERTKLYVTAQTAMQEVTNGYQCVGAGDYLAHYLIRPHFTVGMPERRMLAMATYALSGVKDYVTGCGGLSVFLFLRNNGNVGLVTSTHPGICEQVEKHSKGYDFLTGQLLWAMADEETEDSLFEQYLTQVFNAQVMALRREWSAERKRREGRFALANPHLTPDQAKRAFLQASIGMTPDLPPSPE
jgi:hypothetical protein